MSIQPTFNGYVGTIHDALLLFQATINGLLMPVSRRPHDRERAGIIKSGAVFIFSEQGAGIKRWTDGISWSPSRILGNFLVYRQLEKPFGPGEKKRAAKKTKIEDASPTLPSPGGRAASSSGGGSNQRYNPYPGQGQAGYGDYNYEGNAPGASTGPSPSSERSLVGSLVDSYGFKENGLIKKTISIVVSGIHHHMVSYYKPDDVLNGKFMTPSETEGIRELPITEELIKRQNFRIPPDSLNTTPGTSYSHNSGMYGGANAGGANAGAAAAAGGAAANTATSASSTPSSAPPPQQMPYYGQGSYYNQQFQPQMPPPIGRPQGYPSHPQGSQTAPGQYPQSYPADYDPAAASGDQRGYVSGYRPFTTALPGISGSNTPTGAAGGAAGQAHASGAGAEQPHHGYYYNQGAPGHPEQGAANGASGAHAQGSQGAGQGASPSLPPLGGEYSSGAPSNYSAMDPRKLPEGGASQSSTPAGSTPTQAPAPHGPLAAGQRGYGGNYSNPSW
ncbi:Global transcription regulator sge1 [Yarrowia sp. B02]|nr:Global transcription regulator sge1 [Yarrowia sp. B02]